MKIGVVGAGGHAKVIIDMIEQASEFEIAGLLDAHQPVGAKLLGYQVLGSDNDLPQLVQQQRLAGVVVAIGDNALRAKIVSQLRELVPKLLFPAVIHPAATVARTASIGGGTVLMAGAVVNSYSTVGEFCILNTNCSLDHDCRLGNFVSLAPNSCAGGTVEIGDFAAVCLGANVVHRIKIGANTVVGAGATVLKDLPANVLAFGTPARIIRERQPGEKYL